MNGDSGEGITFHADGSSTVTGVFDVTASFSPAVSATSINLSSAVSIDIFVASYILLLYLLLLQRFLIAVIWFIMWMHKDFSVNL